MAFIRDHHLVVWRFHDHWHRRQPDGGAGRHAAGARLERGAGGRGAGSSDATRNHALSARRRHRVAASTRTRCASSAGPTWAVTRRSRSLPGAAGFASHREALQRADVQVLVIGEAREWETVEYMDDAVAAGEDKALVVVGHIPSEQAGHGGMRPLAERLRYRGPRRVRGGPPIRSGSRDRRGSRSSLVRRPSNGPQCDQFASCTHRMPSTMQSKA